MEQNTRVFVAMDTHKETIAVAVAVNRLPISGLPQI